MFQLNLDGQQITQKVAGSGFGQPKFSREAIAEFQIVTNMFDITQGRSAGIQVQAISQVGHQHHVAAASTASSAATSSTRPTRSPRRCCRTQNQQVGGTLGGPIVKDKMHFFASYEYEREPGTIFSQPVVAAGPELHAFRTRTVRRASWRASTISCRRTTGCRSADRAGTGRTRSCSRPAAIPSNASVQTKDATNVLGTWSQVMQAATEIQEVKGGYNDFDWTNAPQDVDDRHARVPRSRA